jgi:hypothetical protein
MAYLLGHHFTTFAAVVLAGREQGAHIIEKVMEFNLPVRVSDRHRDFQVKQVPVALPKIGPVDGRIGPMVEAWNAQLDENLGHKSPASL